MSDDRTEEAIRRAERAKEILEHPLTVAAFADLDAYYMTAFRNSDPHDAVAREDAHRMLRAMDALKAAFEVHIHNGQMAAARLEDLRRAQAVAATNRGA